MKGPVCCDTTTECLFLSQTLLWPWITKVIACTFPPPPRQNHCHIMKLICVLNGKRSVTFVPNVTLKGLKCKVTWRGVNPPTPKQKKTHACYEDNYMQNDILITTWHLLVACWCLPYYFLTWWCWVPRRGQRRLRSHTYSSLHGRNTEMSRSFSVAALL